MKTKLAYGILAAALVAIPAYGEGEEREGQEQQTPERTTATVVAGGTKTYTNADDWDLKEVPNGDHVDVVIDNNPEVNTTVNFNKEASNYTCGVLRIDAGDKLNIGTGYSEGGTTLKLTGTCVTNHGEIAFGGVKKNSQHYYLDVRLAPSYNGPTGKINITNPNYKGCKHALPWLLEGSVNDGQISISCSGHDPHAASLNLMGGGTFTNNGLIHLMVSGGYTGKNPNGSNLTLQDAASTITGTGTVWLECPDRTEDCACNPVLKFAGWDKLFIHDSEHTVKGEGIVDNATIINHGLFKSEGAVRSLDLRMQYYRSAITVGETKLAMTNMPNGRIVAASPKGVYLSNNSRPNWNTRFINLGLLEARTGSKISFAGGVNTTSGKTGDSDLNDYDGAYLELWGRIAGGGQFVTRRRIYIADGAKLMPGDLANTDGTGESTCGTITFPRLVLRGPAAIADSEETTSGAITEFQCRKPEAGKYDSVWVNGDATVAGTLKFLENPSSGTYPIFTSTGTLTCDLKTLKVECSQGVKAPKLKLVESTYPVEEEVGVVDGEGNPVMDAETGLQVTETKTVDYPCQRIEATWMNGFTITLR